MKFVPNHSVGRMRLRAAHFNRWKLFQEGLCQEGSYDRYRAQS